MPFNRRKVAAGFTTWLSAATGKPGAVMQGPTLNLGETFQQLPPYFVVDPAASAAMRDSWGGVYDEADVPLIVVSYGIAGIQAEAMADEIRKRVLDNQTDMVLSNVTVMKRMPQGGPELPEKVAAELWEVRETFVLMLHTG